MRALNTPHTLKLLTKINSTGEWQGSSKQLRQGQMLMFPHRVEKFFIHLCALSVKKSNLVIIGCHRFSVKM